MHVVGIEKLWNAEVRAEFDTPGENTQDGRFNEVTSVLFRVICKPRIVLVVPLEHL